ncbi:MAG TPA: hypothetical protein VEF53_20035 [Patescibacteria group bacterium]|nr:hypothetical protein [Patescibacteria group bacterium]
MNSNVTVPSNVYLITQKPSITDLQFIKQVRGYNAVKRIADSVGYARLTEKQKLVLENMKRCRYNKRSDVYGVVIENGKVVKKCRCENIQCLGVSDCKRYDHFELISEKDWHTGLYNMPGLDDALESDDFIEKLYEKLLEASK